jgi:hypothetical protein
MASYLFLFLTFSYKFLHLFTDSYRLRRNLQKIQVLKQESNPKQREQKISLSGHFGTQGDAKSWEETQGDGKRRVETQPADRSRLDSEKQPKQQRTKNSHKNVKT